MPGGGASPNGATSFSFVASLTRSLNGGDETAWLNLGYWDRSKAEAPSSYPEAAEALARAVADAARLGECRSKAPPVVVDVGCGLGESLTLWARAYDADLRHSVGVNVSAAEVAAARARGGPLAVRVVEGDATRALPVADGGADAVLAVDAAYHFRPRAAFLREAGRVLRPGGTFGAADIIAAEAAGASVERQEQHSWARWLVCAIVGIPLCNVCDEGAYRRQLGAAGLGGGVVVREATAEITGGFAAWAKSRGSWVLWAVGTFLEVAMRGASLRFVIVSATKV
jgi:MPBQ/MSBQ methyltransferase